MKRKASTYSIVQIKQNINGLPQELDLYFNSDAAVGYNELKTPSKNKALKEAADWDNEHAPSAIVHILKGFKSTAGFDLSELRDICLKQA